VPAHLLVVKSLPLIYAALRILLLLVLISGRFTSATALLLLLLEAPRIFLFRLDIWVAVVVSAALLLYLFGAGPLRLGLGTVNSTNK
jgi:hypothetical protein